MTICQAPYYNKDGCLVTPACAGSPYVPAKFTNAPILSWNSGADSIAYQPGDAHCVFSMPVGSVGVVLGFKYWPQGVRTTLPNLITHGFYFQTFQGASYFQVLEAGQAQSGTYPYSATDTFEIRRVGSQVTYWYNGALFYTSTTPSNGVIFVNTCLYASGDQAPGIDSATLAASFSWAETAGFSDNRHVTFADTSTGSGISWRTWSFSGATPTVVVPQLGVPGSSSTTYLAMLDSTITLAAGTSTLNAYFASYSGEVAVTLVITDGNGDTSSITQSVTLPL